MSFWNYRKAIRLIKKSEDYESDHGVSSAFIDNAEKQLGIKLSPIHRKFLKKYGFMCFNGWEIFGLAENIPEDAPAWGNLLKYTLIERKEHGLPSKWLPLVDLDDGDMAYLDYSSLIKNEPRVIIRAYDGNEYISHDGDEIMDMGDFLLFLAQQSTYD